MKQTKLILCALAMSVAFGSCTVMHTAVVTNNSVGSKTGTISAHPFKKDVDLSYESAMKKGNITKVGVAEMKIKAFIIPFYNFKVTGE